MEISQRTVTTGGFETFYHQTGAGNEATLLLLHGSGPGANAISNWQFALPFLGQTYHCLAPDIAGFGESPCDQPPSGAAAWIDVWVRQMVDFIDALGLQKVSLVGNSMGGGVSLHLVDRYPDRFDRVVLMGAVGAPFVATEGLKRGWGYYQNPSKDELAYLVGKFLFDPAVIGGDVNAIAETRYKFVMQDQIRDQFVAMFPGDTQTHVDAFVLPPERLAKMEQPFLLTHGREDFFIPLSNSYHMEEHLPNAQLHVFAKCGHWIQIEQRNSFNNLVRFFFDGALDQ